MLVNSNHNLNLAGCHLSGVGCAFSACTNLSFWDKLWEMQPWQSTGKVPYLLILDISVLSSQRNWGLIHWSCCALQDFNLQCSSNYFHQESLCFQIPKAEDTLPPRTCCSMMGRTPSGKEKVLSSNIGLNFRQKVYMTQFTVFQKPGKLLVGWAVVVVHVCGLSPWQMKGNAI